jgi:hypothetical protein
MMEVVSEMKTVIVSVIEMKEASGIELLVVSVLVFEPLLLAFLGSIHQQQAKRL